MAVQTINQPPGLVAGDSQPRDDAVKLLAKIFIAAQKKPNETTAKALRDIPCESLRAHDSGEHIAMILTADCKRGKISRDTKAIIDHYFGEAEGDPEKIAEYTADLNRITQNFIADTMSNDDEAEYGAENTPAYGWPNPLNEKALDGLAGEIVNAIAPHSEADPVALLINLVTAFGNAAGANRYFEAEADRHYRRLFCALVGETSKSRKGSSWGRVKRLLEAVEPEWRHCLKSGLSSGEGLIWAVRDPIVKGDAITDPGVEDKRLFCIEAEMCSPLRVMARSGNTLSPTIRSAWDTGDLQTLTKNSPAKAIGAHVSILAHVTKMELLRHIDDSELGNGFANRFLWVCVRRSKCLPEGGGTPDLDSQNVKLHAALRHAQIPGKMYRSSEAKELWAEIYPELSEGCPGLLGAVTGRSEAQVMRLAMIYALLDCRDEIEIENLTAALALWQYCWESARYIFGDALGDPVGDEIIQGLKDTPEGLTKTEISALFKHNKSAHRIGQAIRQLEGLGMIRMEKDPAEKGRPPIRYFLGRGTKKTKETN